MLIQQKYIGLMIVLPSKGSVYTETRGLKIKEWSQNNLQPLVKISIEKLKIAQPFEKELFHLCSFTLSGLT